MGRWLRDESEVPHQRNQDDVARVLGVDDVAVLWPSGIRARVKTGYDKQVFAVYPYRSACPTSVWGRLIEDSSSDLIFSGYTNYFFWPQQPDFSNTLRRKSDAGCRIRFLLGDPESEATKHRERVEGVALTVSTRIRMTLEELAKVGQLPGLEARFSAAEDGPNHVSLSVFRFDADAMVTPHLASVVGHDSPLMHLRQGEPGGLFDRFSDHVEELWERGRPIA
ncbi:DUF5919 domain-containing protein [Kitasatospora sp. NPDC059973]|uniref:DUF5919 domain-containing protein n=1 Tax=unclassified Kitasatospora TaxID=2633591 RepID=UPI003321B71B